MSTVFSRTSRALRLAPFTRAARLVVGAVVVSALAACSSEVTTSPVISRSNSSVSGTVSGDVGEVMEVKGLKRDRPLTKLVSQSQTFTSEGGVLDIPELGFSLLVPPDAIPTTSLTITVTAGKGKMVSYDFQPHGTQFLKPLTIRQSLVGTDGLLGGLPLSTLAGGYFKSEGQLNTVAGTAVIDESFNVRAADSTAAFDIWHFSGYMVSTGRR